jgi:hypothetical protein
VLGHELVHAFQFDITADGPHGAMPAPAAPAAVVHRGHGRVPVAGPRRSAHRHVDARRGRKGEAA